MSYWALDDVDSLMERSRKRLLRVVKSATGWRWFTQEGVASDPFPTQQQAEDALREHLEDTTQIPGVNRPRKR